jgi:hypothetical protein
MSYDLFKEARNALSSSQNMRDKLSQGMSNYASTWDMSKNVLQETAKAPLRVGGAMVDVGRQAMGQQPLPRTNIPGLGEFATPARNTYDESMQTNDPMQLASIGLKNASGGILDAAATGGMANLAQRAIKPPYEAASQIDNHRKTAEMLMKEFKAMEIAGGKPVDVAGIMSRLKTNIVDDAASKAPEIAKEISKLDVTKFSSPMKFAEAALQKAQGLGSMKSDLIAASIPGTDAAIDTISDSEEGSEEDLDEETVGALSTALGVNKTGQAALKEESDRLQKVIMHTWDKPKVRSRAMKAFKLIAKLIK